jgi:hypothetical protein
MTLFKYATVGKRSFFWSHLYPSISTING